MRRWQTTAPRTSKELRECQLAKRDQAGDCITCLTGDLDGSKQHVLKKGMIQCSWTTVCRPVIFSFFWVSCHCFGAPLVLDVSGLVASSAQHPRRPKDNIRSGAHTHHPRLPSGKRTFSSAPAQRCIQARKDDKLTAPEEHRLCAVSAPNRMTSSPHRLYPLSTVSTR